MFTIEIYANIFQRNYSSWGWLSKTLAGGIFLVLISVVGQLLLPRLHVSRRYNVEQPVTSLYGVDSVKDQVVEAEKVFTKLLRYLLIFWLISLSLVL